MVLPPQASRLKRAWTPSLKGSCQQRQNGGRQPRPPAAGRTIASLSHPRFPLLGKAPHPRTPYTESIGAGKGMPYENGRLSQRRVNRRQALPYQAILPHRIAVRENVRTRGGAPALPHPHGLRPGSASVDRPLQRAACLYRAQRVSLLRGKSGKRQRGTVCPARMRPFRRPQRTVHSARNRQELLPQSAVALHAVLVSGKTVASPNRVGPGSMVAWRDQLYAHQFIKRLICPGKDGRTTPACQPYRDGLAAPARADVTRRTRARRSAAHP